MISRAGLVSRVAKNCITAKQPARGLYTNQIYPYPFDYYNNQVYPSQHCYRETFPTPPWQLVNIKLVKWGMRIFWTYFFFKLFSDPGVILGHLHVPDPASWTDAELGIPPDDVGLYEDWLTQKLEKEDN